MNYLRLEKKQNEDIKFASHQNLNQKAHNFFSNSFVEVKHREFFILSLDQSTSSLSEINELLSDSGVYQIVRDNEQTILVENSSRLGFDVMYRPGVTDNIALTAKEILKTANIDYSKLRYGNYYEFVFSDDLLSDSSIYKKTFFKVQEFLNTFLSNNLIQQFYPCLFDEDLSPVERFSENYISFLLDQDLLNQAYAQFHDIQESVESIPEDIFFNIETLKLYSDEHHLALSENELRFIIDYFSKTEVQAQRKNKGLFITPSDVEVEVIAQTWSEHCKHKIFGAKISYSEQDKSTLQSQSFLSGDKKTQSIDSLYKETIKNTTKQIVDSQVKPWCLSVFKDNAGVIKLCDDELSWAIKVETHNSPSALDAYGGALTGILGVNRDILGCGLGFKPVANLDVFCLAPDNWPNYEQERSLLPKGPMTPERMLEGVHKGVQDGGNHSGIPTVAGAFCFDPCFAGKPLVFCGTLGVAPTELASARGSHTKSISAGDLVVVVGGAVGADGIHGATFSSRELDATSPTSAVQIGDPLMQKRVLDFILEARDKNLFEGITDNGAGGLSSSIGEMAEFSHGAKIDLSLCPLKYFGLKPFEIMISESQERMSLAVDPSKIEKLKELAKNRNVPLAVLGEFTDNGFLEVFYRDKRVACLDMDFLHNQLPQMQLRAHWSDNYTYPEQVHWPPPLSSEDKLLKLNSDSQLSSQELISTFLMHLLESPNIASKEKWIRSYDHEVQGATVGKPLYSNLQGRTSPRDGGVISSFIHGGQEDLGACLGVGLRPILSRFDTYIMAIYAVDEAFRNLLAQGADPNRVAMLDNFCWPDPVESTTNPHGAYRLAQLVRCCFGLREACLAYQAPLVSGKDSMKNDFKGKNHRGDKLEISVDPTLLVTGLGRCSIERIPSSAFDSADEIVYIMGPEVNSQTPFKWLSFCGSEIFQHLDRQGQLNLLAQEGYEGQDVEKYENQFKQKKWSSVLEVNKKNYQSLFSAIEEGLVQSAHDISEGGALCAISEMCFANDVGVRLDVLNKHKFHMLFGEGVGHFILSVKKDNKERFESFFDKESLCRIGQTHASPFLSLTLDEDESRGQFFDLPVQLLWSKWNKLNEKER